MQAEQTTLEGCFLIRDTIYEDERGYFFESFNAQRFYRETGINIVFVQDNLSHSIRGVLRGLHFQKGESAQAKLVRVLKGEVLDVAVDLRKSSPTFGQYYSVILSETSHTQLYIPRGFAHGFLVLSEVADFFYKCDNYYDKAAEGGVIYNDFQINISWKMPFEDLIISSKDLELPALSSYEALF
ncbi:MAG: dTDP-4-dehydrorhamnose 3,5-epimerase [Segetibacter sp.]